MDADSLHSAAETSILIHGIIAFWYWDIKFGTEVLGSEAEMVGYGAEITRPTTEILNSGGEVLSLDAEGLSAGAEK